MSNITKGAIPLALGLAVALCAPAALAQSTQTSEVIMRQDAEFESCKQMVSTMIEKLNAKPGQVVEVAHSSAIFKMKIVSREANLVFICNDVTRQIEVRRTTPGEWVEASN